ncbi:hypothetical protein HBI56_130480 [Parastagonospora nodorum]|uniref:Uncharacterized protein n=1 Tax=Phaeosphaeria nodorum (strain SN15 / ATCC MYA-4574 / FGSC 10173) TaxID=321614 RepID=A0A7U2HXY6_PHANO|nr:hypothetical protein HBH56_153330 [Parastagonospora nodorum]QRC96015.1 hypothetical protein JI435_408200 [Parastagonospora nodorum SN15]KAH3926544.1 hypothetical protein HBH54_164350 [Parastagonospora nodorum]KAH3940373.1 hypothetical protein HBH53_217290 [Parastagonospora nodorum]KAH3970168.1 hypothetical protein HBH52_166540 [Parastagonospora nodorum]
MLQNHRGYPFTNAIDALLSIPAIRPTDSTHHSCMLTVPHLSNRNCPEQASRQAFAGK